MSRHIWHVRLARNLLGKRSVAGPPPTQQSFCYPPINLGVAVMAQLMLDTKYSQGTDVKQAVLLGVGECEIELT